MAVVTKIFHGKGDAGSSVDHAQTFADIETEVQTYFNDNTILKNDVIYMSHTILHQHEESHDITVLLVYNNGV